MQDMGLQYKKHLQQQIVCKHYSKRLQPAKGLTLTIFWAIILWSLVGLMVVKLGWIKW